MSRWFVIWAHRVPFISKLPGISFFISSLAILTGLVLALCWYIKSNYTSPSLTFLVLGPRGRLVQPSLSTLSLARRQEFLLLLHIYLILQIRFSFFHILTPPTPSKMTSVKKIIIKIQSCEPFQNKLFMLLLLFETSHHPSSLNCHQRHHFAELIVDPLHIVDLDEEYDGSEW